MCRCLRQFFFSPPSEHSAPRRSHELMNQNDSIKAHKVTVLVGSCVRRVARALRKAFEGSNAAVLSKPKLINFWMDAPEGAGGGTLSRLLHDALQAYI